jgi:hypothetical protein
MVPDAAMPRSMRLAAALKTAQKRYARLGLRVGTRANLAAMPARPTHEEADLSPRSIDLSAVALCIAALAAIAFLWNSESRDGEAPAQPPQARVTEDSGKSPAAGKTDTKPAKTPIETALLTTPWPRIDVTKHMRIHDRASAEKVRADIVKFVWPSGRPLSDPLTKQSDNSFPSTELWTLTMKHGIVSRMFFVRARSADASCLFIYHDGHGHPTRSLTALPIVRTLVERFTSRGCDVLLLSMPLYRDNHDERFQSKQPHDELRAFETSDFSPLSYFIDPVIRAIDEATKRHTYARIGMSGLSGGGWTTTFAGAVEPRIKYLYAVAGSMPFAVDVPPELVLGRNVSSLRGDYEESHFIFREVADYLDFYLLDVYGPGRRAINFYLQKDDRCFPAAASHAFSGQMTALASKITGNSLVFVVDTAATQHELSLSTMDAILADFTGQESAHRR